MRLWSLDPSLLDRAGLLGLWREALLAQAVLLGKTSGYRSHPQLKRFQRHANPVSAIGTYLHFVHAEATKRGYKFDYQRIYDPTTGLHHVWITTTRGQLEYEFQHLVKKLDKRDPPRAADLRLANVCPPHPLFRVIDGPIESWERVSG